MGQQHKHHWPANDAAWSTLEAPFIQGSGQAGSHTHTLVTSNLQSDMAWWAGTPAQQPGRIWWGCWGASRALPGPCKQPCPGWAPSSRLARLLLPAPACRLLWPPFLKAPLLRCGPGFNLTYPAPERPGCSSGSSAWRDSAPLNVTGLGFRLEAVAQAGLQDQGRRPGMICAGWGCMQSGCWGSWGSLHAAPGAAEVDSRGAP